MQIKKHIGAFALAATRMLLGAAIVFNLVSNNLHELSEHFTEHEIACSEENENDACHRFIFHHEQSESCNGSHDHVRSSAKECFSCKFFKIQKDEVLSQKVNASGVIVITATNLSTNNCKPSLSQAFHFYLRGPPIA